MWIRLAYCLKLVAASIVVVIGSCGGKRAVSADAVVEVFRFSTNPMPTGNREQHDWLTAHSSSAIVSREMNAYIAL
jgi:hypothetical protein